MPDQTPAKDAAELPVLLTLDGLAKTYPNGFRAVEPTSMTIRKGEFLTLLGPSGCGKTTTLRMLGGFEEPTEGRLLLGAEDITHRPPNARATNMVFQDYALFPHMSVAENVAFGPAIARRPRAETASEVAQILEVVGLADKAMRLPAQLSGGQRQRVALARALIQKPRLLLLDEPLGALDANMREQMQIELKEIQARLGITFVMVTHDQHEALTMSDRIAVMNHGRVAQLGTPEELYDRPADEFVANFLGANNILDATGLPGNRLRLGTGELISDAPLREGPLRLGIRPERIVPATPGQSLNVLETKVVKRTYFGNLGRLSVAVDGGPELIVDVATPLFDRLAPGAALRLHVPPEALRPFS